MILRNSVIVLFLFTLLSCGSTKKITETETLPDWVKYKPVSSLYYIGVGSAIKTANSSDYHNAAKNNALADLASEISVNISTSSVLHKFESTIGYSEDYSAAIKASAKEKLEGYELVNSFESVSNYYVYYRLLKSKHAEISAKRKADAIQKGLDFYNKARSFKKNNNYYEAISSYIKGLEAVKEYFSESLETNYEGQTIFLGNELFIGFQKCINEIQVKPIQPSLTIKKGEALKAGDLTFEIINTSQTHLKGIPIVFSLGKLPLRNSKVESDVNGKVSYQMTDTRTKANEAYFIATVDMKTLASGVTFDPFFRKLIRKFDAPKGQIHISINNPVFYVSATENNLGVAINPKIVEPRLQQIISQKGYPVVFDKTEADYQVLIEVNTAKGKQEGKMYYVNLNGSVKFFDAENKLLALKPFNNIEGVQLNYNDAGIKAYENLVKYLEKNFLIKLNEAIN